MVNEIEKLPVNVEVNLKHEYYGFLSILVMVFISIAFMFSPIYLPMIEMLEPLMMESDIA